MTPTDTASSYDQLAERWRSRGFSWTNGIAQHERALAFLEDKRYALDVGCGSSGRIIELLTSHGFRAEGVDVSGRMIELARQSHPDVTFWHEDICDWTLPRQYDLITAWDSVWHVPLACQGPVLRKMLQGLTAGGVCIFTTPGLDLPSEKVDSAMGPPLYYSGLGIPDTLKVLSQSECVCRHLEYDRHPELHVYVIAQRAR